MAAVSIGAQAAEEHWSVKSLTWLRRLLRSGGYKTAAVVVVDGLGADARILTVP